MYSFRVSHGDSAYMQTLSRKKQKKADLCDSCDVCKWLATSMLSKRDGWKICKKGVFLCSIKSKDCAKLQYLPTFV